MKLYGFTILRNGLKYDYPFLESLRSLCALCEEVFVALGNSDDGTAAALAEFKNLVIIPTVWDEEMRKSGLILSAQTNVALEALRKKHSVGWAIYLQADEVLDEKDFSRIKFDLAAAEASGCDALSFRYLHFWQSYHQVAINKRWYPHEIRAINIGSKAESYGDAQSFHQINRKYFTEAIVFHYGHVREPAAYEKKKADFNRWWHSDDELKKVLAKGARRDKSESTVAYYGPQPSFMKPRMGEARVVDEKNFLVFGRREDYPGFESRVRAKLRWSMSVVDLLKAGPQESILLTPLPLWLWPLRWMGFGSKVPSRMRSPQALAWSREFIAILRFSERGVVVL